MTDDGSLIGADALWARMRLATEARIGLARHGAAVSTRDHLAFQFSHARARDAIDEALDVEALLAGLAARGLDALPLRSAAETRVEYLARPDLGRQLDNPSRDALISAGSGDDLVIVLADGLSARATMTNALPLIDAALPLLRAEGWRIGPVAVVTRGRVAIGDEIGQALRSGMVAMLIGERPGLSSPHSLGVYLTWAPRVGRVDAERNCLSNIRDGGMSPGEAATRLTRLCAMARAALATGVALKDDTPLRPTLRRHEP